MASATTFDSPKTLRIAETWLGNLMADVQCGRFELVEGPTTDTLLWRARVTPAPSNEWIAVFREYLAVERGIGNSTGNRLRIDGEMLQFEAPESLAQAAANLIRRVIEKTNPEAAKREAQRQRQNEAQQTKDAEERRRLREKYRGGI